MSQRRVFSALSRPSRCRSRRLRGSEPQAVTDNFKIDFTSVYTMEPMAPPARVSKPQFVAERILSRGSHCAVEGGGRSPPRTRLPWRARSDHEAPRCEGAQGAVQRNDARTLSASKLASPPPVFLLSEQALLVTLCAHRLPLPLTHALIGVTHADCETARRSTVRSRRTPPTHPPPTSM